MVNFRCRAPSGQFTLSGLNQSATLASLKILIEEKTGLAPSKQEILSGYPPKLLQGSPSTSLSVLGLSSDDTLVVRESEGSLQPEFLAKETTNAHYNSQLSEDEELARALAASLSDSHSFQEAGISNSPALSSQEPPHPQSSAPGTIFSVSLPDGSAIVRREIESDNSCLFNAVGYIMERSRSRSKQLRNVIAEAVAANPETYTEGFLGKSNSAYQSWIRDSQKWGGAIELSILARYYEREIAAYDIQTKRVDVYGQDAGYRERVMLLYDGLHYDALVLAAFNGAPEEMDVTIFERGDLQNVELAAAKLVDKAHRARKFTDTGKFTLRCGICYAGVTGEKEAMKHAQQTGHQKFSEYH